MATPTENWPKPYLLRVHEEAVKHGFIWIENLSKEDAESLKSRLYRIRRRSDKSMAAFIPPEFHLVMIGVWEPAEGSAAPGRMPAIYNKKSDGTELPTLRAATGEEVEAYVEPPKVATPLPPLDLDNLDLIISEDEIPDFISKMRKDAAARRGKDQP